MIKKDIFLLVFWTLFGLGAVLIPVKVINTIYIAQKLSSN